MKAETEGAARPALDVEAIERWADSNLRYLDMTTTEVNDVRALIAEVQALRAERDALEAWVDWFAIVPIALALLAVFSFFGSDWLLNVVMRWLKETR